MKRIRTIFMLLPLIACSLASGCSKDDGHTGELEIEFANCEPILSVRIYPMVSPERPVYDNLTAYSSNGFSIELNAGDYEVQFTAPEQSSSRYGFQIQEGKTTRLKYDHTGGGWKLLGTD